MNTHTGHRIRSAAPTRRPPGAPAPGRPPRSRQRARARRRRRQKRSLGFLAAFAGTVTSVFLYLNHPWQQPAPPTAAPGPPPAVTPAPSLLAKTPEASDSPRAAASPRSPEPSPSARTSRPPNVPESGPGTFTVAQEGVTAAGSGHPYRVEVENGSGVDPDLAAEDVAAILTDPRGWSRGGTRSFRQVNDSSAGLVIRIGTPDTTDRLCGTFDLHTRGELNCRGDKDVMVNLRRWQLGSPTFDGSPAEYRALIINHEVGHWLGHGHETCPGPGRRAPAMMQQIKGLKGCVSNAWPYTSDGKYLGGPSVR